MKIKLFKHLNHIYRPCIFCSGQMVVSMEEPDHNDNTICSTSACKKCRSVIVIETSKDNYVLVDE